jgi:integrase
MTVSEMLTRFIVSRKAAGLRRHTILWYSSIVNTFIVWLADQPDQALTTDLLEVYLIHLRERPSRRNKPLSDVSVASNARALRSFFRWCQQKRLIAVSPMVEIKIKKPEAREPKLAGREEIATLLRSIPVNDWVGLRDFLIVHVLFFAGLRVGELVQLEARHFDVDAEILLIPGGKTGGGLVPMLKDVIEAFFSYETHRPRSIEPRFLLASNGYGVHTGPLTESGVRQMLKRRCREAGIRHLPPHSMRHGLAMHLLNDRRVDASLVQKILRHSNIKTTTETYARWTMGAAADEFKSRMGNR